MRLRNGAHVDQATAEAVMELLRKMPPDKRVKALGQAHRGEGFFRGRRMTPRLANVIISAVLDNGTLRSPYAEEQ